jgi:hypothetical protein
MDRVFRETRNTNLHIDLNSMKFHVEVAKADPESGTARAIESVHTKLKRNVMFTARRSPENYPFNSIDPEIYEALGTGTAFEARKATATSRVPENGSVISGGESRTTTTFFPSLTRHFFA